MNRPLHVRVAEVIDHLTTTIVPAKSLPFSFEPDVPNQFPREDSWLLSSKDGEPIYFLGGNTNDIYEWGGRSIPMPPRYDIDWEATGPLIEEHRIAIRPTVNPDEFPEDRESAAASWDAYREHGPLGLSAEEFHVGKTPLEAVCNLILALGETEKVE